MDERERRDSAELDEKRQLRKALVDITNRIHSALNIRQILIDLKEGILDLFSAHSITIYVVDRSRSEIYSLLLIGSHVREIRVPINNRSIAGYVAHTGRIVNIADAYDAAELKSIDKALTFDPRWDKRSGFRTRQILAAPIFHNDTLMGVVQILNKKGGGGKFTEEEKVFLQEISTVLGVAFFNQGRYARTRESRYDDLISRNLLTREDLVKAGNDSREANETLEAVLMKRYRISRADLGRSFAEFYRCAFITYSDKTPVPDNLLANLKKEYLRRELWVPLGVRDGMIHVIIDDPHNLLKRDSVENLLKTKSVRYDVALSDDIVRYIDRFYAPPDEESTLTDILGRLVIDKEPPEEDDHAVTETDSMIMQLVNTIILDAQAKRASDIHIEPNIGKRNVEVRYRIDGDCALFQTLPYSYRAAVVSRIKIMSNLDITIRRIPQDGRIRFRTPGGGEIELRVATIPTQGGVEDVVLRILAKGGETLPLTALGLSAHNEQALRTLLTKPHGMILVAGPTGSGKTTALHAALKEINRPDRKIWTAEDPVEITQHGLRQVQVQPKIGFDFAAAMRAFLRADPDVIMVGEMRDFETAKIGTEASLTGHLVFSTLHTNSAPETIVRLLDMGLDPFNFADALLGILAQRLVRTLCGACREAYHPDRSEFEEMARDYGEEPFGKLNSPYDGGFMLYRPTGCDACDGTGYRGRTGIHELMVTTEAIKRLIQKREAVEAIRARAIAEGMTTLLQDGITKSIRGVTDFKQVRRVCMK